MKKLFSVGISIALLALFSLLPALAGEGRDEVEPNDTRGLADSIDGNVIRGHCDEDDEDDWFVLEGQEGLNPTFFIDFDEDELEIDLEIFSGDDLVAHLQGWGPEDVTLDIPGKCFIHVYWWSGEGDYTIEIETAGGFCEGEDEIEPNDTDDLADFIDELEIEGYACEDDEDWFVLDGQEGFHPTITLIYDDDECDLDMDVYSDDELVGSLNDVDSPDSDDFEIPGTCYLHVYAFDGEGAYTIEIDPE